MARDLHESDRRRAATARRTRTSAADESLPAKRPSRTAVGHWWNTLQRWVSRLGPTGA